MNDGSDGRAVFVNCVTYQALKACLKVMLGLIPLLHLYVLIPCKQYVLELMVHLTMTHTLM